MDTHVKMCKQNFFFKKVQLWKIEWKVNNCDGEIGSKYNTYILARGHSQVALVIKDMPANEGKVRDMGSNLGWKDPEEFMATHSSNLAQRIKWDRDFGGLQSIVTQS